MTAALVPVLLYHSVAAPGRAVTDHWQVAAADFAADLDAVVASGRLPMTATAYAGWLRDPARAGDPVLVTFDDGFADYADVALPLLQERGIPGTLFVTTGWIGRPGMLSRAGVADLAGTGTELGGHGVTHVHLDTVGERRALGEIAGSRRALEDVLGAAVSAFAYPHGSHRTRTRALVAQTGHTTAHAVKNALSHDADDPFAVARYTVTAATARQRVRDVLACRTVLPAPGRERWRTTVYRGVRTARRVLQDVRP
jgi:peptidoglycan/xylan/chitin deacetylase (PgdA/CDA1 family)